MGLVFGMGFPPFTGGISHFARREGFSTIVQAMDAMAKRYGPRFEPPKALRDRV